ncbi:MAG: hypothetical protein II915_01205, partial [Eubacterium sp.]|nr:hypothetical protein [Eubacterium sp.]
TIGGDEDRDISFIRKDGVLFSHKYKYVKDASIASGSLSANGFLYESMDGIEDGFKYVIITTDTPATTYHIELRYADTEADVLNFADGPYKNCLSYGISSKVISEKNEAVIEKAIAQIVYDSLPETQETNAQRGSLVGIWDYNFSSAEQGVTVLDNAKRFIKNAVDGTGAEYRDALGTGNYDEVLGYKYFVYDATPEDAVNSGTYLRYIPGKGIQVSAYSVGVGGDGRPVVTFKTTGEQDASYTYRGPIAPDKVAISAVKAKGKKISISWSGAANTSRYQIVVSTSKNFKKLIANKSTDKTSITVKVKKKKTYYVKVRGYAEDAFGGITYGDYIGVKKVKVK